MTFLPIVIRELRVAARRRAGYWFRLSAAGSVILLGFLVLFTVRSSMPAHQIGRLLFGWESSLVFAVCLFSGVFLTADCLSFERREGTLGLLFLADLRGYDIVLGKLASCSVECFTAVLAMLPMLGLPLLMGGTTGGEFWRLIVVLVATMVWSLSIGMVVSASWREPRATVVVTLSLIVILSGTPPVLAMFLSWTSGWGRFLGPLAALSPVGSLYFAYDNAFRFGAGKFYWMQSVAVLLLVSVFTLCHASFALLKRIAERSIDLPPTGRISFWRRQRFVRDATRRRKWLDPNPFYWLAARDRLGAMLSWPCVLAVGGIWGCFFLSSLAAPNRGRRDDFLAVSFIVAYALHALFKALWALEATRRLHEDRQSGALELLLATPLPVHNILEGQWEALRRQFIWPLLGLLLVNVALICAVLFSNPMHMHADDQSFFSFMVMGGAALLMVDVYSLTWLGVKEALRRKRHHWAALTAFGIIMAPTAAGVMLFVMIINAAHGLSESDVKIMFTLWLVGTVIYSLALAARARSLLLAEFRPLSAGTISRSETGSWPAPPASDLRPLAADEPLARHRA